MTCDPPNVVGAVLVPDERDVLELPPAYRFVRVDENCLDSQAVGESHDLLLVWRRRLNNGCFPSTLDERTQPLLHDVARWLWAEVRVDSINVNERPLAWLVFSKTADERLLLCRASFVDNRYLLGLYRRAAEREFVLAADNLASKRRNLRRAGDAFPADLRLWGSSRSVLDVIRRRNV